MMHMCPCWDFFFIWFDGTLEEDLNNSSVRGLYICIYQKIAALQNYFIQVDRNFYTATQQLTEIQYCMIEKILLRYFWNPSYFRAIYNCTMAII